MNHVHRIGRWLASLAGRAIFPPVGHAAMPAVAVTAQPGPPRWTAHSPLRVPACTIAASEPRAGARPQAPPGWLRTIAAPAWLPHTIQLCVHCRANPAGFWVSRTGGKTVRRPWCLSCCHQGLDRDRCDMIPFNG
jgi:hypothetical protein